MTQKSNYTVTENNNRLKIVRTKWMAAFYWSRRYE